MMAFLPISKADIVNAGWDTPDFVYVIADAYVDHPSFGPAIISRVLQKHGYKVSILAQPDWKDGKDITSHGKPRLGFLVSGGNMDSMLNHYTVNKKRRSTDAYSAGGKIGKRPDRASIVYSNLIRQYFGKDVPIILGGIEPSLRRMAHYDYWSDKLKHSILIDSQASIVSYGMGEKSIVEIANALNEGYDVNDITFVRGTVYRTKDVTNLSNPIILPSFEKLQNDKKEYAKSFALQYENTDAHTARPLVEEYDKGLFVVQNPPAFPLSQQEMDEVYALPYERAYHPVYEKDGGVPAISEIKFSLTSSRGCFGACSFCALTFHQGRVIQSRSIESLEKEVKLISKDKDFKGYVHDVGGPTANFRHKACKKQEKCGVCKNKQCLFPTPCENIDTSHEEYIELLRRLRKIEGVKKVFIRSGIRFDYLLAEGKDEFLKELCMHHVSGQLKIAPEHISDRVLNAMGKPKKEVYEKFVQKYVQINEKLGKKQYIVPYLMSSHPGSTMQDAIELAVFLKKNRLNVEQVQDFYPTPSTVSTCMYYTGIDPRCGKEIFVETDSKAKKQQRALMRFTDPDNYELVKSALIKCGRQDLIGNGKNCLIPAVPPANFSRGKRNDKKSTNKDGRKVKK